MDSRTNRKLMNRVLVTTGNGDFFESNYELPECLENEICVQSIFTGVCRSDIDMMNGDFGPLPLSMQGHEGLAKVIKVGANIKNINIGDIVATRGEPAYADMYNVREREFVVVPEVNPKYILEPVACGINVVLQALRELKERSGQGRRLLILGSGFLSWVAYNTLILNNLEFDITVLGKNNLELWRDKLSQDYNGKFDVVIDLSNRDDIFTKDILQNEALIIFGVEKQITTSFSNLLWKACTIIFPSPRTDKFYNCMTTARDWISNGKLNVDNFWTKGYNRDSDWQQAFIDGNKRPAGYSRGYIYWK